LHSSPLSMSEPLRGKSRRRGRGGVGGRVGIESTLGNMAKGQSTGKDPPLYCEVKKEGTRVRMVLYLGGGSK